MKLLFSIAILIMSNVSLGQDLAERKKAIDAEVQRITTQAKLKEVRFSIQALKKVLHYINYSYSEDKTGYVKISRRFSHKNDSIQQIFYLKNGQLIQASEIITTYFTTNNGNVDSIGWSGVFYFSKNKLVDHITLGHGKSEEDTWNPEQEILTAFQESKRDIARYKKKRNGG